ncbi:uncharacterized protein [Miscanthus floridulus]
MAGAATPRSSSPATFSRVTCGAARLASLNNTHLNKMHTITWEEFKKKQEAGMHGFWWTGAGGVRLRLWSVAAVRAMLHGRRAATTRAVLHSRRAATTRGMPQCMDQFGPYLGDAEYHRYLSKEPEACGYGSGVWQRWCGKQERKAATARASAAWQKSSDGEGNASIHEYH